mmetsp:Transcript_10978/g.15437  ORF Transcript_10978/g.15437 Transcript_10978/m.15437 type:complete len:393 (-) Transcript_10978:232-1410(-)
MAKKSKRKSNAKASKSEESHQDENSSYAQDMEFEGKNDSKNTTDEKLTLAALDAISDEEGDEEMGDAEEWNAEAKALRQAIAEGAFDALNVNVSVTKQNMKSKGKGKTSTESTNLNQDGSRMEASVEGEDSSDSEAEDGHIKPVATNMKALRSVVSEIKADHDMMPWPETFVVMSEKPLPFNNSDDDEGTSQLDVHDDLKRELVFYNAALDAVHNARKKCEEFSIPFTRPEDYFAEMVKTDDHMAKIKDKLIFETKKMEAVEQRKSNREHKLRAKESHAHRLAEKAKAKKEHLKDVDNWAKNAQSNRLGSGMVHDDDTEYLQQMNKNGPNKKRIAADKKYGFGGKRGRFKKTDPKSLNDMSDYNPRGNFGGLGKKGGTKRKGKRARDASKSR